MNYVIYSLCALLIAILIIYLLIRTRFHPYINKYNVRMIEGAFLGIVGAIIALMCGAHSKPKGIDRLLRHYYNKIEIKLIFVFIVLFLLVSIFKFIYTRHLNAVAYIDVYNANSTKLGCIKIPAFVDIKQFKNDLNNRLAKLKLEDGQEIFFKGISKTIKFIYKSQDDKDYIDIIKKFL